MFLILGVFYILTIIAYSSQSFPLFLLYVFASGGHLYNISEKF